MKREANEGNVLKKGKNYVKFHRLLAKAEADGRLDGKYRCPVCGMRFHYEKEADDCCRIISD
ncbi:MAG: hypothetical protein JW814_03605 [Candidatus Krumholzibacteriota bacterium]|nr:hypothetical protein [Candidatus Krumholzibacteriota bacterium]